MLNQVQHDKGRVVQISVRAKRLTSISVEGEPFKIKNKQNLNNVVFTASHMVRVWYHECMITVIIAGGSGTRLWPLSTPDYPKHLLRINGDSKSLLQNTYKRAKQMSDKIYIVTDDSHAQHIRQQLPDLTDDACIVEPARRGTANCIINALAHLHGKHDEDEPVAFLHADHYVRDIRGFVHSLRIAGDVSKEHGRIVLIGIEPSYPADCFGYIQKDKVFDEGRFVFTVDSFKEKPEYDLALEYFKSGDYLWNAGYFVGSLGTFKRSMQSYAPKLYAQYQKLLDAKSVAARKDVYLSFKNEAIDYALLENADDLLVVPAAFDWMDLGSYGDLHKAVDSDKQGNHTFGSRIEIEGVENSFIQNHEDKPVAVIGLDNVVVINSPNGILVARKDLAQKVGEVSKRISKK